MMINPVDFSIEEKFISISPNNKLIDD